MDLVVNVSFRNTKMYADSERRSEHIFDRMRDRGIGVRNIKDAVQNGAKTLRKDGSVVAEFRWFKVVYRQFEIGDKRKIYPITVMLGGD